jgi:hypothetical protein
MGGPRAFASPVEEKQFSSPVRESTRHQIEPEPREGKGEHAEDMPTPRSTAPCAESMNQKAKGSVACLP